MQMKLKVGLRLGSLALLALCTLTASAQSQWPFDQRQILLVQSEGLSVPDPLTLAQIMDVFVQKGRVRWMTQKGGPGQIVPVEVPKDFAWQSSPSVRNLGLKYKVDGIVSLISRGAQIDLRWYSTIDGQPLFFESLYLPAAGPRPAEEEIRRKRLRDWLLELWAKIPGRGFVVKRDIGTLQLEGGVAEGLKVGDKLELLRLQDLQRHPLLKTLIGIKSSLTGTATVTSVGEPFSSAKVDYEAQLDPIREGDRYHVVVQMNAAPLADVNVPKAAEEEVGESFLPKLTSKILDLDGRLSWATLKHEESTASDDYKLQARGLGFNVLTRLYVTRTWIAGLDLGFGPGAYADLPDDYGSTKIDAGWSSTRFYTGYRMIVDEASELGAAEVAFTAGYRRFLAKADGGPAALAPSAKSYTGIDLGLELKMPILEKWSVRMALGRVLGTGLTEEPETSGDTVSSSLWSFDGGLRMQMDGDSNIGAGVSILEATSIFKGEGTRATPAKKTKAGVSQFYLSYERRF